MTFTVFFVNERILPGARLVCLSRPLNGRYLQNLMWFSCFLEKSKDITFHITGQIKSFFTSKCIFNEVNKLISNPIMR